LVLRAFRPWEPHRARRGAAGETLSPANWRNSGLQGDRPSSKAIQPRQVRDAFHHPIFLPSLHIPTPRADFCGAEAPSRPPIIPTRRPPARPTSSARLPPAPPPAARPGLCKSNCRRSPEGSVSRRPARPTPSPPRAPTPTATVPRARPLRPLRFRALDHSDPLPFRALDGPRSSAASISVNKRRLPALVPSSSSRPFIPLKECAPRDPRAAARSPCGAAIHPTAVRPTPRLS
jgi:hypothetical protein